MGGWKGSFTRLRYRRPELAAAARCRSAPVPFVPWAPMKAGYDEIADGYARHWGPVIQPAAERVIELIAPAAEAVIETGASPWFVDVGAGSGAVAIAALERWPMSRVTGIDPSAAMLALARDSAAERLAPEVAGRLETEVAWADELPFDDGSVDLALSAFVLQLVASRAAALREIRRVLRPGGTLAWVAWLEGGEAFEPDRVANGVLDEAGFDPPDENARSGDIASVRAAAHGMRRAGFRDVRAHAGELVHRWDPAAYLAFLTGFDEKTLFSELGRRERRDIERRIRDRLARLTREQLTLRLPVVYVLGRAPG